MKNEELDLLTDMAADISQSLGKFYLDGDGNFIDANLPDDGREPRVVPASEVLSMLTAAERKSNALYLKLKDHPRRQGTSRRQGDDQA